MSIDEPLRADLHQRIARNKGGKYWTKVKTLLGEFGYTAQQRVRQSSLAEVLERLETWGITATYSGTSANDYITLTRRDVAAHADKASRPAPPAATAPFIATLNPFSFVFRVGDSLDEARSRTQVEDLLAAVWSFRPVCLLIDATDEFFAFAGGYLSAIMRRRAAMTRVGWTSEATPESPELLSLERIKSIVGQAPKGEVFPLDGAVYLVRDSADDAQDDELVALIRELYVPHTHRMKARFATTSGQVGTPGEGGRAQDHPDFSKVLEWMAAFAGGRELVGRLAGGPLLDLASLMAEATSVRDTLVERETLKPSDPAFRAGYESTEHMVLKSALLRHLKKTFPGEDVLVETDMELPEPEESGAKVSKRHARPDLRVLGKLWVEVETLRGLSNRGSNPFFTLESKLRTKLDGMKTDSDAWLVVPTDVALLAPAQVCAVAHNLSTPTHRVRPGFVDLLSGSPVMLERQDEPRVEVRLAGASWREARRPIATKHLSWSDVAGYEDLRSRLSDEVVGPLINPDRYAKFGISAPNGLLLYGLPGCGKSLIGRVLAGLGELTCKLLAPSDLTSMWLGEGVGKTRELFDWALKQPSCLLILDEIDAVAPQRSEMNMHADEKRQVNELLAQLDRIAGKPVMVVATTNYIRGVDTAIRRSGRFDLKVPVMPPALNDRKAIYEHYLSPKFLTGVSGVADVDTQRLAEMSTLFTPADIRVVVETTIRRAIARTDGESEVVVSSRSLEEVASAHQRSIQREMAVEWLTEARSELGVTDPALSWLEEEIARAYPAV